MLGLVDRGGIKSVVSVRNSRWGVLESTPVVGKRRGHVVSVYLSLMSLLCGHGLIWGSCMDGMVRLLDQMCVGLRLDRK